MVDAVLPPDAGVTHDVFSESYSRLDKTVTTVDDEGNETVTDIDLMDRFKHIYVKEVVREPRMNFQRVPKLGSFMAVPLIYKSCLFDDALSEAVANWQDVKARQEQQELDKENFETQQLLAKDAALAANQEFEPEERVWEEIKIDEFKTEDQKFVVCLDTMG